VDLWIPVKPLKVDHIEAGGDSRAAIEKGDFAEPTGRDSALHASMAQAWRELERHGEAGLEAFRLLLSDESPSVRSWVAPQLLCLGDESGFPVLEELVANGGMLGFSAEAVLREWRAGRLQSPFSDIGT